MEPSALLAGWKQLASEGLNNRAIALRLGVSEARLVASGSGSLSTALRADACALFEAARGLGVFKMVARNDYAVLERPGAIRSVSPSSSGSCAVESPAFSLRMASDALHWAFALREAGRDGPKRSLQLFDASGTSICKLVLRPESDVAGFDRLCRALRTESPHAVGASERTPAPDQPACPDWIPGSLAGFLHAAARLAAPLHIEVANGGCTLAIDAAIRRIKRSDKAPWINVLDPELDLHLFEGRIDRVAVEKRPGGGYLFLWLTDEGRPSFRAEATDAAGALHEAAKAPAKK